MYKISLSDISINDENLYNYLRLNKKNENLMEKILTYGYAMCQIEKRFNQKKLTVSKIRIIL